VALADDGGVDVEIKRGIGKHYPMAVLGEFERQCLKTSFG
jgi:hypothetical protein